MRGRPPKDPAVRQRTNKIATADDPDAPPPKPLSHIPPLRKALFGGDAIHAETRRWWRTVWRSPIASRWITDDVLVLEKLVVLQNQWFGGNHSIALADAIGRHETRIGLDPMGRKRFEWRVQGPGQPKADGAPKAGPRPPSSPPPGEDPRKALRVVS